MEDIIAIVIIVLIVGLAGLYVFKKKKKGSRCIGCPYGDECCSKSEDGCFCSHSDNRA